MRGPMHAVFTGDALTRLRSLPAGIVQTCITSPPYFGLRDYGCEGQIGLEQTPAEYVARLVAVFEEVRRVLKDDGTLWLNLGDSYAGSRAGEQGKGGQMADRSVAAARCRVRSATQTAGGLPAKNLIGVPWRVAFALQAAGWYLRQDIIWAKPNPMPAPVTDRCVSAHEYVFLLSKSPRYYFDHEAIREDATGRAAGNGFKRDHRVSLGGRGDEAQFLGVEKRNKRSVWTVTPKPLKAAHFAVMPPDLVLPCVLAGSGPGDIVLDPFNGAGTTGVVAMAHGRRYWGIELNPEYVEITRQRLAGTR